MNKTFNLDEISYGAEDLLPTGEYDPRDSVVRVSFCIRGDVLLYFKAKARETGVEYETLMNAVLQTHIEKEINMENEEFFTFAKLPRDGHHQHVANANGILIVSFKSKNGLSFYSYRGLSDDDQFNLAAIPLEDLGSYINKNIVREKVKYVAKNITDKVSLDDEKTATVKWSDL